MRVLDNIVLMCTSDSLVRNINLSKNNQKVILQTKYTLVMHVRLLNY